ncbi:hypothetical protein DF3PA_80051 [Candidatus Defluviicoccus seviourii]|uniref:Uncharacterized protein n=1 Tax=Candidatus Defluviicoccus seviourii TaxID=2565273 RepID=A0A564WHU2_9PROT|nr:hypothetical protein DF3PA_80051 [Candidatus Defluviicoccus seviourii]
MRILASSNVHLRCMLLHYNILANVLGRRAIFGFGVTRRTANLGVAHAKLSTGGFRL